MSQTKRFSAAAARRSRPFSVSILFPWAMASPAPSTQEILPHYLGVVRGTTDKHAEWRIPIGQKALITAASI